MDNKEWFDDLSRILASRLPRRQTLKLILVGAASQILPISKAEGGPIDRCNTRPCPEDRTCTRFEFKQCLTLEGVESTFECRQRNTCGEGEGGKCIGIPTVRPCSGRTPFCVEKNDVPTCVECRRDRHCKERTEGEKGVECCNHVCCDICNKCTRGVCIPRCPPRRDPARIDCCSRPEGDMRVFTQCCKHKCCDMATGACIEPKGRISRYKASLLELEIQEAHVGLGRIEIHELVNATVDIPPFTEGTTAPVYVTATRLDLGQKSTVLLNVRPASSCDCDECSEIVDPTLTQLTIPEGTNETTETFERIPQAERFVTIQNGYPGLRRVQVFVNGEPAADRWLRDGLMRFIDVEDLMMEGENVITVIANGRPGASALLIIADVPSSSASQGSDALLPIQWDPTLREPGQNLTWGR